METHLQKNSSKKNKYPHSSGTTLGHPSGPEFQAAEPNPPIHVYQPTTHTSKIPDSCTQPHFIDQIYSSSANTTVANLILLPRVRLMVSKSSATISGTSLTSK